MAGGSQRTRNLVAIGLNGLFVVASTLFGLAVLEAVIRVWQGTGSRLRAVAAPLRLPAPAAHDPLLGYIPQPNSLSLENYWDNRVTVTADGTRSNGNDSRPQGPPILAVGDSFTFGDEVDDHETWPAHLERLTGRRVNNAGVFGYGFDQMVLRAEQLLERLDPAPELLIVSLITDDVKRCEFSYRYAWKPYFEIDHGALTLRNVPVPTPDAQLPFEPPWQRWARMSLLGGRVMTRLHPDGWLLPQSVRVHEQGIEVSELLVDRLRDRFPDLAMLFVLQWDPNRADQAALPALARAKRRGIPTLRMKPILRSVIGFDDDRIGELFFVQGGPGGVKTRHMHDAGNRVVAKLIAERLREIGR